MRLRRWQEVIVDVLVGASAVALAVAALNNANAEPIVGAIALVGIALMFAGDIAPQRLPPPLEGQSARAVPEAAPGFDAPIVDAVSV